MKLPTLKITYPVRTISNRVFFLLLLFLVKNVDAQVYYFDVDHQDIHKAYQLAEQLKLDQARAFCDELKISQPGNLMVYHVENYIDFYHCFISEEDRVYKQVEPNKELRLTQLTKGDENSPYFRFSQAEVILQWALVDLKFKNYLSALININKATNLLEENKIAFPEFILNDKSLSVIHAVVGTIPDSYKKPLSWVSSFEGTIAQGYSEISAMTCDIDESDLFYKEVYVIKALIEMHLVDDKQAAWSTASNSLLDKKATPLMKFVLANVAHRSNNNDIAISILSKEQKAEKNQLSFYYLDFLHGAYRLNNLEETADQYLLNYVKNFKGKNYIKESYLKLAWFEYAVNNDKDAFFKYLELCKVHGESITDEDKYASRVAQKAILPNRGFLRARLLFDGGYFERAMDELNKIEASVKPEEVAEFQYRKSRILFEQRKYNEALVGLYAIINRSEKNEDFHITSLYYIALTYERAENLELATSFYKRVLSEKSGAYKSSLHQKAKAGLLRLSN